MLTAPWLGLIPGPDGQVIQFQDGEDCPVITLFKSVAAASISNPPSFRLLSRKAEAAGVDNCFDIFLSKLCDCIFTYYKSWAASELLDPSFLFASDNGEKFSIQPMRFTAILKSTRVKIWLEMQNDFLPNFILCNTTQRFVGSLKVPPVPVQKPSVPCAKPNFNYGIQDPNSAYQSFARLHSAFFGMPHMYSIGRLLGSRSLPWLVRALLDHVSNKI